MVEELCSNGRGAVLRANNGREAVLRAETLDQ
jgi:hypothetical protein